MKIRAIAILFIILISLLPAYYMNRLLQKILRPRQSFGRLMAYMLTGMALVFLYTLLLVFVIKMVFPKA